MNSDFFNADAIPPELRDKARAWFARQMAMCEAKHGPHWRENREWVAEYLNAELAHHLEGQP